MKEKQVSEIKQIIQESPLTMSPLTPLTEAILEMTTTCSSYVLAVEQQQLLGIFTERDLVRLVARKTKLDHLSLAEIITKKLITLNQQEIKDIFQVSKLLNQNKIRHLPVVDEQNRLLGIITPQSINKLIKPEYLLRHLKVRDAMATDVIFGFLNDSVFDLIQKMVAYPVSCIVIMADKANIPVGIITERDIAQFQTLNLNLEAISAQTVMSTPLATVQPDDSLWSVYQKMQQRRVRRLVVVKATGQLAGIVTQTQILKLPNPIELYQVIEHMQLVINEQTQQLQRLNQQLQATNEKLIDLAMMDELTQVMNRRRFNEYFEQQWQRLNVAQKPLSLIICDVDDFKLYNDIYGHVQGDRCLVEVAQALQQSTRQTIDLVARYGGEEFAIILPNCNLRGAKRVALDVIQRVKQLKIPHQGSSTTGYVTVSLGVASTIPSDESSPKQLLQEADELLYRSKQKGRNTYRLRLV